MSLEQLLAPRTARGGAIRVPMAQRFPLTGKSRQEDETVRAFVMKEIGKVAFMDKPVPDVGSRDALVRTTRP
ncbi:UNVERIFIED_CONTAM: hypothetical protein RKD43_007235 [Streptomyces graminofaciens]